MTDHYNLSVQCMGMCVHVHVVGSATVVEA